MKSFKQILSERNEIEDARRRLASTPVLSDVENKARLINTPEGPTIITNAPESDEITPEEQIAKAERGQREQRGQTAQTGQRGKKTVKRFRRTNTTNTTNTSTNTPTRTNQSPKLNLDKYGVKVPDPIRPVIASTGNRTTPRSTTPSTERVTSAVKGILKAEREAKAAERASLVSGASKFTKNLGRAAGLVGAGLEAKTGYETARGQGASQRTAAAIAGSRGAGALAGAATGARIGGLVAGLPGAVLGGIGGYAMGTNAADSLARGLRGDFGKQFNTKDLRRNIRNVVPYEIRSQVPANLRQDFGSFLTRAGRTYGDWRRSQRQNNNR